MSESGCGATVAEFEVHADSERDEVREASGEGKRGTRGRENKRERVMEVEERAADAEAEME